MSQNVPFSSTGSIQNVAVLCGYGNSVKVSLTLHQMLLIDDLEKEPLSLSLKEINHVTHELQVNSELDVKTFNKIALHVPVHGSVLEHVH